MYVCLSITGLRLKYTSLRTLWHVSLRVCFSSQYDGRLRGETMMPGQRMRPEVQKTFKSDERRQCDSKRRRLTHKQQSDSPHSLTAHEQDRQRTVQHRRPCFVIVSVQTSTTNFPCPLCEAHHAHAYT